MVVTAFPAEISPNTTRLFWIVAADTVRRPLIVAAFETLRDDTVVTAFPADKVVPLTVRLLLTDKPETVAREATVSSKLMYAVPKTLSAYPPVAVPIPTPELDKTTPPIEFEDAPALLIVPLDRATPPIEFDTPPGVEIAPVAKMVVCPLESSEFESVHPPIVLDVAVALEIVPPLSWTLANVYDVFPKFPEMFPPTFRLFVIVIADIVVIPVATANVNAAFPAAKVPVL